MTLALPDGLGDITVEYLGEGEWLVEGPDGWTVEGSGDKYFVFDDDHRFKVELRDGLAIKVADDDDESSEDAASEEDDDSDDDDSSDDDSGSEDDDSGDGEKKDKSNNGKNDD